jgi:acetoacetate decarboxylase
MPGIPSLSPLYPDPPYEYWDQSVYVAVVTGPVPPFVLPEGLTAGACPRTVVVFARRPQSTIGSYNEAVVLVQASWDGSDGSYCPLIYVDSEVALCAGREVWGFPKKLAEIVIDEPEGELDARLVRNGEQLIRLRARIAEPMDVALLSSQTQQALTYCHKMIPSVNASEPDIDTLTVVRSQVVIHDAWTGAGTIEAGGEMLAVLNARTTVEVTKEIMDSVLPPGEVLQRGAVVCEAATGCV